MHHLKEIKLESILRMTQERSIVCSGVAWAKGKTGKQLTLPSLIIISHKIIHLFLAFFWIDWISYKLQGRLNIIDHTITCSCNGPTSRSSLERKCGMWLLTIGRSLTDEFSQDINKGTILWVLISISSAGYHP